MTVCVSLSVDHEKGRWDKEAGQAEPTWGWAVIRLGSSEISRAELDYHVDGERNDALERAAVRWLRQHAESSCSQATYGPERWNGTGRRYDTTVTGPLLDRLEPGVSVERELAGFTEEKGFTTAVPCCGRRITVPICETREEAAAVCCRCSVGYRVSLSEELTGYDDDPFRTAIFSVESLSVAVARHRSGK